MVTFLISVLIIYSVSVTVLFFMMREMLNEYIQSNENEEPKTKYDWSNVPEYIEFITTCKDGTVKGYCKPIQRGETWCSSYTINGMPPYQGEWQDSLEERPR